MTTTMPGTRRAFRDPADRFLGGVAAGLARHLAITPLQARVGFLLLTLIGGFGAIMYAALWVLLPVGDPDHTADESAPGLAAASRRGARGRRGPLGSDMGVALSLAMLGVGAIVFFQMVGAWTSPRVFWPVAVAAVGLGLLWWQSDSGVRADWLSARLGWRSWLRTLFGVALLVVALWLALFQAGVSDALDEVLGALLLAATGIGLVAGPWLLRLTRELRGERAERVRSQERADVAAHLHDSVLQTLALIQRQSGDAAAVSHLARTQERELRTWLFEPDTDDGATLRSALQQAVADVEAAHHVPVEVVVVGDFPVDDQTRALIAAAREAVVNASRHSGADRVDVYVEVAPDAVDLFVRDRGRGFVLDDVADDRLGVRRSIVDRVMRHGGSADLRSAPGDGTEVRLRMPRTSPTDDDARGESTR